MSRAKGYKCYNSICRSCVGTFCNEPGDNALYCAGRSVNCRTNADRIRDMSDEELLDFMIKTIGNAVLCKTLGTESKFCSLEWLQQPAEEEE